MPTGRYGATPRVSTSSQDSPTARQSLHQRAATHGHHIPRDLSMRSAICALEPCCVRFLAYGRSRCG
eukprot:11869330-Alexandrium_andersonii.AAC.1